MNIQTSFNVSNYTSSSSSVPRSQTPFLNVTNSSLTIPDTICSIGAYSNLSCIYTQLITFSYPYTGPTSKIVNTSLVLTYDQEDILVNKTYTNVTTVTVVTKTVYPTYTETGSTVTVQTNYWSETSTDSTSMTNLTINQTQANFTYTPNFKLSSVSMTFDDLQGNLPSPSISTFSTLISTYNKTYPLSYSALALSEANTTKILQNASLITTTTTSNYTLILSSTSGYSNISSKLVTQNTEYHACSSCNSTVFPSGCSRCNATQCLECESGRTLLTVNNTCLKCELQSLVNPFLYSFLDYRSNSCSTKGSTTIDHCDIGFLNSRYDTSNAATTCQLKCGSHQYPVVTFTSVNLNENIVSSRTCAECPDSCGECIGSNALTECTLCNTSYYLHFTDLTRRSGQCLSKQAGTDVIINLYVSTNDIDVARNGSLRTGSFSTPFVDLMDAVTRGKELASVYSNTVSIYIYLFSGDHFLLRNRGGSVFDFYQPTQYFDPLALNYQMFIQPLSCSSNPSTQVNDVSGVCTNSQVKVFNKRREIFVLDVPVQLKLTNIILDSMDSILPVTTPCLNERRRCCRFSSDGLGTIVNVNSSDTFVCSSIFTNLNLNGQCQYGMPRTLFRMRVNNQSQLADSNKLTLFNSGIRYLFYDMNSLVNLTQYGGQVTFYNSTFTNISICGGIIKNTFASRPSPDLNMITSDYLDENETSHMNKINFYVLSFYERYYQKYFRVSDSSLFSSWPSSTKFKIQITNSSFSRVPSSKMSQPSSYLVALENAMRYQGSILTLDAFAGDVRIQESKFENNIFNYDGCDPILNSIQDSPLSISSLNNFNQLYNSQKSYKYYQIKALISITTHARGLYLYSNIFTSNNGLKGIINIGIDEQMTYPLIINGNTFLKNSGAIDSNVLSIRKRNSQNLLGTAYPTASTLRCGGIQIASNNFTKNVGCTRTNGVLFLYCFDQSLSQSSSIVKYVSSYDSQYFVDSSGDASLLLVDLTSVSTTSYTDSFTTVGGVATTQTANLQSLTFNSNTYTTNFAGGNGNYSIVNVQGFPLVSITGETYFDNQNYFHDAYILYSKMYSVQSSNAVPVVIPSYTQNILNTYANRSQSILTITRALNLQITSVSFQQNFVLDQNTPSRSSNRSNALLIRDFYGSLTLSKSRFSNNNGISSSSIMGGTLKQINIGFSTYLIAFTRSMFSSVLFDTVTFQSNTAYYDSSQANAPYPYLFVFDVSMVNEATLKASVSSSSDSLVASKFQFKSLSISKNLFFNGYGMIFIGLPYSLLSSWQCKSNGNIYDANEGGVLVYSLVQASLAKIYQSVFSTNIVNGGGTINVLNSNQTYSAVSTSPNLQLTSAVFSQNIGNKVTSILYVQSNPWMSVLLESCQFSENQGAVTNDIYFQNISQINMTSITWKAVQNYANAAQFLLKDFSDATVIITNSQFSCGVSSKVATIKSFAVSSTAASLFVFSSYSSSANSTNTLSGNSYTLCNLGYQGAILYIVNGQRVSDSGSSITSNSALFGGVAFVSGKNSYYSLSNPGKAVQSNSAYYGGVFYVENQAAVSVVNTVFLQNKAYEGAVAFLEMRAVLTMNNSNMTSSTCWKRAVIVAQSSSQFIIKYSFVQYNIADQDSVFIFASNTREPFDQDQTAGSSNLLVSYVWNSNVSLNTVTNGGSAITLIDGVMNIKNCVFTANSIFYETEGIYATQATLWVSDSQFYENRSSAFYQNLTNQAFADMSGAFISIGRNTTFYGINLDLSGGLASNGGCVQIQGSSSAYFQNSRFSKCVGYIGGAIYAANYLSLVVQQCSFSSNMVYKGYGQNILASNTRKNLTILDSTFSSYHNSILIRDTKFFSMSNSHFTSEALQIANSPYQDYSGAIQMLNCITISITGKNTIENMRGETGGSISIIVERNIKSQFSPMNYSISGLTITNSSASITGGAIYLEDIYQLDLSDSVITGNSAINGSGGGIELNCNQEPTDICLLNIKSSEISNNVAKIGGGVYFNYRTPSISSDSKVQNNYATSYGHNLASFPRELVIIEDPDTYLKYYNKSSTDPIEVNQTLTSFAFENVQSGGFIPTVYFGLVDQNGQIVQTTSGTMIQFALNNSDEETGSFETEVSGVSQFFSAYGVFNVSGLQIVASPGSSQKLVIKSYDAVDLSIPSTQSYLAAAFNVSYMFNYYIPVTLTLRNCIEGEALSEAGACSKCPEGTYLLLPPTQPQACKVCPAQKATCTGGNNIGPKPGYWRKSNTTDNFIVCYKNESCLQMINFHTYRGYGSPNYIPTGACGEGYYGALCSACLPGYSRSGQYGCNKCPHPAKNLVRIIGIILAIIAVIGNSQLNRNSLHGLLHFEEFNKEEPLLSLHQNLHKSLANDLNHILISNGLASLTLFILCFKWNYLIIFLSHCLFRLLHGYQKHKQYQHLRLLCWVERIPSKLLENACNCRSANPLCSHLCIGLVSDSKVEEGDA